ncbi:MAG: hypothetical protein NVS9B1_27540 [Candidatus Dormibacteraceae bacterium]
MDKQTKRDLEKTLEAKAKGKQLRKKIPTDNSTPTGGKVDTRVSKLMKTIGD